jgi:hypothetical protein
VVHQAMQSLELWEKTGKAGTPRVAP